MSKAPRKEIRSAAFPFTRQFTATPFFVGLEDARLKSQLLLNAVKKSAEKKANPKLVKKVAKKKSRT